jgi:collagenase-like PrtC family protease
MVDPSPQLLRMLNEISQMKQAPIERFKILPRIGSFSQFVQYFGVSVFALWKNILTKRRILFYNLPPVESSCYHGMCC